MKNAALFLVSLTLVFLITPSLSIFPKVAALPPRQIATFHGTVGLLGNGTRLNSTDFSWIITQDPQEFLFYYNITGGSGPSDVIYVTIDEAGLSWPVNSLAGLKGSGWSDCVCSLPPDTYTVVVESDPSGTALLTFDVSFYRAAKPPVDFAGLVPSDAEIRSSDFAVQFTGQNTTFLLNVTQGGQYELLIDQASIANVTQNIELIVNNTILTKGFHVLEVDAAADITVGWSIHIVGVPELEVEIINPCQPININSSTPFCVLGANATTSDGSNTNVTYSWDDGGQGGTFNSTIGQWVKYSPPLTLGSYILSVQASAPGYITGSAILNPPLRVVPEFPFDVISLLVALFVTMFFVSRRPRRRR